jgi:hypothetical protein
MGGGGGGDRWNVNIKLYFVWIDMSQKWTAGKILAAQQSIDIMLGDD